MINPDDLLRYVIKPTLAALREVSSLPLDSSAAEILLLATCAQETLGGRWLHQRGRGPARGIYQMEPATYAWVLDEVKRRYPALSAALDELRPRLVETTLEGSLHYATAITRARYWIVPHPLPAVDDFEGIWRYYKVNYNSELGAATRAEFVTNWEKYGKPSAGVWV